uniref:Uncharacterized protein n=1 Tax=Coccidioides posadasii RMSCC 3488 TaxID=454284 RepID=A0A0J6FVF8_COCPO|nr:hypothetical protein CPAG_09408 [Coccidioides posadasii RMSCC 3488]
MILTNVTVLRTHTVSHSFSARKEGNEAQVGRRPVPGSRRQSDQATLSKQLIRTKSVVLMVPAKWWDGHTAEHWGAGSLFPEVEPPPVLGALELTANASAGSPRRPESLSRDRYADPTGKLLWTLIGPPIIPPLDLPLLA